MGSLAHFPRVWTSSVSIPLQRPSTSAAWMRSSSHWDAMWFRFSVVMWRFVSVCHRFMATVQPLLVRRQDRSMTSFSLPISAVSLLSLSGRKLPSGLNRYEVTMMWDAPAVSQSVAFCRLIPPPICMPFGHAASALSAAFLLSGVCPSWMMCPPVSWCFW